MARNARDSIFFLATDRDFSLGGVPREQKMLKGHFPKPYHRVYFRMKKGESAAECGGGAKTRDKKGVTYKKGTKKGERLVFYCRTTSASTAPYQRGTLVL